MKLNIKTKLIGGFMVVVGLMVLVGVIGWNGLSTLNAATDHIVHEQLPEDEQLRDLEFQVAFQGELYFEYALTLDPEILEEARSHTQIIRDEAFLLEEELAGEPEMLAQLRQFEMEYEEFHNELELVAAYYLAGDTVAGVEAIHIAAAEEEQLELELAELAHEVEQQMEASFAGAERSYRNAVNMILGVSVVAVVVALALAWFLSRSISNGVASVSNGLQKIAVGDLTAEVDVNSSDEIGDMARAYGEMQNYLQEASDVAERIGEGDLSMTVKPRSEQDTLGNAFSQMVTNLRGLVGQVGGTADKLSQASDQLASSAEQVGRATEGIATASQQVAAGAEEESQSSTDIADGMTQLSTAIDQVASGSQEQATSVDQASNIVAQVSKATSEVASSAQSAAEGARAANEAAREGSEMVTKTVEGMGRIKAAVDDASQKNHRAG